MIRKLTLKKEREHETNEASIAGNVMRDLIAHVTNDNLIGRKIKSGELRKKMVEPPWKCPDMFTMTTIEMEHFTMEWLELKENPNEQKVILQLHGGGYIGAMRNAYRMFAGLYNEVSKGMSVLTIDYRVAPENPYPAALEDALAAYQWIMERGYPLEKLIVAGDSAGGGLALALCLYLRDHDIPLPAGIITMSAWTDLTKSGESYQENFDIDPIFGGTMDSLVYQEGYYKDSNPEIPYISPVNGDYHGFPPMLMQVGEYEMLLSDTKTVARHAMDAGVTVKEHIYPGMFHVFQMGLLLYPEAKEAWIEVGRFIRYLRKKEK